MKKIIYTRPDGGVSVLTPVEKARVGKFIPSVLSMTDDEYIEFIKDKDVPKDATNVKVVDESYIPADRTHRNEWVDNGSKIDEDAVKVQAKLDAVSLKESRKQAILSKMKISKEELKEVLG